MPLLLSATHALTRRPEYEQAASERADERRKADELAKQGTSPEPHKANGSTRTRHSSSDERPQPTDAPGGTRDIPHTSLSHPSSQGGVVLRADR